MGTVYYPGGIYRCAPDDIIERYSQAEELGHNIGQIYSYGDGSIGKQICADRIGDKTLTDCGHHEPEHETAACMPKIELYPSLSGLCDIRIKFSIFHQERITTCQRRRDNIARAQFLKEEFTVGPCWEFPLSRQRSEIRHDRQPGQPASL